MNEPKQTNQRAELLPGLLALDIATEVGEHNYDRRPAPTGPYRCLRRVVIKSDSAYLVNGMTYWIYGWKTNGFVNRRGLPVANANLFKRLDEAAEELNSMDVQVQFWHVRRERDGPADCLANAALDGVSVEDALEYYFEE